MLRSKIKTISLFLLAVLVAYLVIGYLFHLLIFPEKKPAVTSYFKAGQEFYSKSEGFKQTVHEQKEGKVFCSLQIDPFADGPPKHVHSDFDEFFEIENGELTVWLDGKIIKIKPGEILRVPKGTPHKPYNETADTIRVKGEIAFPEKFAYHLPQVYGLMDNSAWFAKSPRTLLQMALFTSEGFDSYVADGPPVFMQKLMSFVCTPLARLMGYRSFYEEYDLKG